MGELEKEEVERWLDAHHAECVDYIVRKLGLDAINVWLVAHGFLTINDYVNSSRRNSAELPARSNYPVYNGLSSVLPLLFHWLGDQFPASSGNVSPHTAGTNSAESERGSSRKCLRHDFARAKASTVFRTHEHATHEADVTASRRNSLRDMRKCTSLPGSSVSMLSLLIASKVELPQVYPVHNRATKRELRCTLSETDFILAIVRDIANDLDLKSLSLKVIDNLAVLLNADGASLFVVEGSKKGRPNLVSKVFDVHSGATPLILPGTEPTDTEIHVPWGAGVLGHVAHTGNVVNLRVACEDPRFDDQVDRITGYHTQSLLCMPVRNAYDEIIAVAQVVNKISDDGQDGVFSAHDEHLFMTYLQFVGMAITNAQIVEMSRREYDRNRDLLEVVHDLFEEQTNVEKVILKIMQRAQRLVKCQRAAVLLLDETNDEGNVKFAKMFELSTSGHSLSPKEQVESASRYMLALAERVASSGQVLNVAESMQVGEEGGDNMKSLVAMPVRNSHAQIIGVAMIVNKCNGLPFDENDEQLFEAFTIFCGLGIHNAIMYSAVEKAVAKQRVAFEVLSYHTTASAKQVAALMDEPVPCADELQLFSLKFDDFSLDDDTMIRASVAMFLQLGLVKKFCIEKETLYRFLITVKRNYRDVPYHNWRHAFNVAQTMFAILMECDMKETFSDIEVLGMFVGCLCHDLDHRGTNNAFQQKTGSPLVLLYGTTNTMEQHHFNHAVMILTSHGHNIFAGLPPHQYSTLMHILKHSILATDLSVYFQLREKFFHLVDGCGYSWSQEDHRELLQAMLMTGSDLAASCKPWPVQIRVARLITQEFLVQGDRERSQLHITPHPLMDRQRLHELPRLQLDWITHVCLPLYQSLAKMNPKLAVMRDGAADNVFRWRKIVERNQTIDPEGSSQDLPIDDFDNSNR